LVDVVSKGGNYLLNVGPTGTGIIPAGAVAQLKTTGDWLARNGEGVYGTHAGLFPKLLFDGRCTFKDNTIYLHVFTWPEAGLTLDGLQTKVISATIVGGGQPLAVSRSGGTLKIAKPATVDPIDTVIAIKLAGIPIFVLSPIVYQRP
jgi:alpha-L-fucosidase